MKARIPKHREFIIDFPKEVPEAKANEGWSKLMAIVEDYKKAHNGQSVYSPPSLRIASSRSRSCRKSTASPTSFRKASNFAKKSAVQHFAAAGFFVCRHRPPGVPVALPEKLRYNRAQISPERRSVS